MLLLSQACLSREHDLLCSGASCTEKQQKGSGIAGRGPRMAWACGKTSWEKHAKPGELHGLTMLLPSLDQLLFLNFEN